MRSRNRKHFEEFGNVFFVTSTAVGFIKIFKDDSLYQILIDNLEFYRHRGDIYILAYVFMPNHFHLVVKTNKGTSIFAFMGNFKRYASRKISEYLGESGSYNILKKLKNARAKEKLPDSGIWKPRFDSMVFINEDILRQKINYIHNNPMRAELVNSPEEWPYSSARNYSGFANPLIEVDIEWMCLEE